MLDTIRALAFVASHAAMLLVLFGPVLMGWGVADGKAVTKVAGRTFLALLALLALHAMPFRKTAKETNSLTLVQRVTGGEPVAVTFDPAACIAVDLGTIQCAYEYRARYNLQSGTWTVTGITGPGQKAVSTIASTNCGREGGCLGVFGALFGFDNDGNVMRNGQRLGSITLKPVLVNSAPSISRAASR
jgi:hypothetical protein